MKIIEFKNVRKEFLGGKILANKDVSFSIEENSVHAIAGENGAGKSTLLSMLFGLYKPTSGKIFVKGEEISYSSAADAIANGLGMVQQHFQLVDKFSVLENVTLGDEETLFGFLTRKKTAIKINKIINNYGFNIKAKDKISSLTVGQEQKVEILKVLYKNSDILIFDEPTAMLTPDEIDEFIKIVLNLKKQGKTILIITHKLDEIKRVADDVSVLRKGEYIGTESVKTITPEKLSKMMVGKEIKPPKLEKMKTGSEILSIENLSVKKKGINKLKNISFSLNKGEILAIAGVEGNGQVELAEAISGLNRKYSGLIKFNNNDIKKVNIKKRNNFISHIPEDRHKFGMILDLQSYENASSKKINEFSKLGFINRKKMLDYGRKVIRKFDVRGTDNGFSITRGLSGGNQQKMVVGRELMENHELTVVFQATRGLDVGAINYIHKQIIEARNNNKAILLISYDLNEVLTLADRTIVLNSGEITGELKGSKITKSSLGKLMSAKKGGK